MQNMPPPNQTETPQCTGGTNHWWLIGELVPGQDKDKGTCRFCEAIKTFPVQFLDTNYEELRTWRIAGAGPQREIAAYIAEQRRMER